VQSELPAPIDIAGEIAKPRFRTVCLVHATPRAEVSGVPHSGQNACARLFAGGSEVLGMGDKLVAVPVNQIRLAARQNSRPIYAYSVFQERSASVAAMMAHRCCRPAGGSPLRIDDGDSFDLNHEIGAGQAGYADGRAGWGGLAKIAHADIATLLKFVKISDEGIGLYDVGPSRTGCLEALVEVFERLFHLGAHVALADAIAVDITGQLTGGVDNLAGTAHRHNV
jgi:hypothetical protein